MNDLIPAAIYVPLGAIIVAVINWIRERRKTKASGILDTVQGAKVVQGMALEMLGPLRDKIERLTNTVADLEKTVADLEDEVDTLTAQLRKERIAREQAEAELSYYIKFSNN